MAAAPVDDQPHRKFLRTGYIAIGLLFLAFIAWTIAPLQGAVIATGTVIVESKPKVIQHLDGGIVAEIPVQNGTQVKSGDVLMRLDPTIIDANQGLVTTRLREAQARVARLEAERDKARTITFPADLMADMSDPAVAKAVDGQQKLFDARRGAATGLVQQLSQRIDQSEDQIEGLNALIRSKRTQVDLIKAELVDLQRGLEKGVVTRTRFSAVQREQARIEGEMANHRADIARINNSISELETQILQLRKDRLEQVLTELRTAQTELSDLREQSVTATDQRRRVDVLSPVDGYVHNILVNTVGGVVAPGQEIMQVIPNSDRLIIEAQVQPGDIDMIYTGQVARLRMSSFNMRTTPEIGGVVLQSSPDRLIDPVTGLPYYTARVEIPEEELKYLNGQQLVPGMPAEVYLQTEKRSVFSYIMKPAVDAMSRGMREE
jgi:HlyD family secretion protein